MTWDPNIGLGTVINTILFIGAIIAIFTRRDKDMEGLRGAMNIHAETAKTQERTISEITKMLHKLTDSLINLQTSHAELRGRVEGMQDRE